MDKYKRGKIYKLWSPQIDDIYIGSTTQQLHKRLAEHKCHRTTASKYLFENCDDVRIELIEEYSCNNKMELNKREGEHIRNNTCLNRTIAGRTGKDRYEENKEQILKKNNKWFRENPDKVKEYARNFYYKNKDNRDEKNNERNKTRVICEVCNEEYCYGYMSVHRKTTKHQENLKNI